MLVLAAVGTVVVTALFFLGLIRPKLGQIADARKQTESAQQQEQQLRNQISVLEAAKSTAPESNAKIARLGEMLPLDAQLPSFIRLVQGAATAAGVDLQSIAPSPPGNMTGTVGIQSVGVNITFTGGFFRIEDFLSRLESLRRVVAVQSLSLTPVTDPVTGQTAESATATLQMFVVGPNAQPSAAPAPVPSPGAAK